MGVNKVASYTKRPAPLQYDSAFYDLEFGYLQRAIPTTVIRTITSNSTQAPGDSVVLCDASGGPISYTLTEPSLSTAWPVMVKKIDASNNTVTVVGNIDGNTNMALSDRNNSISLISDGSAWYMVSSTIAQDMLNEFLLAGL